MKMKFQNVLLFLHVCLVASSFHHDRLKRRFRQLNSHKKRNIEKFSNFLEMSDKPLKGHAVAIPSTSFAGRTDQDYVPSEDALPKVLIPGNFNPRQSADEKLGPEIVAVYSLDREPERYFDLDGRLVDNMESEHDPYMTFLHDNRFIEPSPQEIKPIGGSRYGSKLDENIIPADGVPVDDYLYEQIPADTYRINDRPLNTLDSADPNLRVISNEELISLNVALLSKKSHSPLPKDYLSLDGETLSGIGIEKPNEILDNGGERQKAYDGPPAVDDMPILIPDNVPSSPEEGNSFSQFQKIYDLGKKEEVISEAEDSILGYAVGLSTAPADRLVVPPAATKNLGVASSGKVEPQRHAFLVDAGREEPAPNMEEFNENEVHRRGTRAVNSKGMPNSCHSQHLHKCGSNVIKKFNRDPSGKLKCKIREEFLDCMVQQREIGCYLSEEYPASPEDTNSIRSQIKNLLWSAHGCLLF